MIHERLDRLSILSIESVKADAINLSEVARQFANAKFAKFHFLRCNNAIYLTMPFQFFHK